jgi:hypothetical protein
MTGNDPLHDDVCMLAVRWTPVDHLAAAHPAAAAHPVAAAGLGG